MKTYDAQIEIQMQTFFQTLSEKDKRQYAALEARKLGHGGQTYIARILGCGLRTIQRGLNELNSNNLPPQGRIRRQGAGRKPFDEKKNA